MFYFKLSVFDKKFNTEDEAREKIKDYDDINVGLKDREYKELLENHKNEIDHLKSKISSLEFDEKQMKNKYNNILNGKNDEIQILKRRVENFKKAVGKWQLKAQRGKQIENTIGELNLSSVKIIINELPKRKNIKRLYSIDTNIPNNMLLIDAEEYFRNISIQAFFPVEVLEDNYVIVDAYCNSSKDTWKLTIAMKSDADDEFFKN